MVCQNIDEKEKWIPQTKDINRFMLLLDYLFSNGELSDNNLTIGITGLKKCMPNVAMILKNLLDFGFEIEGFDGKKFNKEANTLEISYLEDRELFDTIKKYFDCYPRFKNDNNLYNKQTYELWKLRRFRFDYKLTMAEISSIPEAQWVKEDIDYYSNYDEKGKAFALELYAKYRENPILYKSMKYMTFYNNDRFHMEFYYKKRRLIRTAGSDSDLWMAVRLRNFEKYMDYIYNLPEHIRKPFECGNCFHCNDDDCKNRLTWTYHNQQQIGCAFNTFNFMNLYIDDINYYMHLIELECNQP